MNSLNEILTRRVISDKIGFSTGETFIAQDPTPRQQLFLDLDDKLEVFYGGAAGGGKSSALLMAALKYVHVPGYAALLLRRSYTDLSLPGALMERAHQWLRDKAHWSSMEKKWTFPSGATLTFGYLATENDKYQYLSSEFQFIGFDEVTQFTETQYMYLFSRLRRGVTLSVPLRVRSGSNPGGLGAQWIKRRFIPDTFTPEDAISETVWEKSDVDQETGREITRYFVPARLDDNPYLDQEEYDLSLSNLDPVTRAQLRRGDWQISIRGDVLYMWDERQILIKQSKFNEVFKTTTVPAHWRLGVYQDWGTTLQHPCVTGFFATAAENSPTINGVNLAGSVFLYRVLIHCQCTAREVKHAIKNHMAVNNEIPRTVRWSMSHEANSSRLEYLNTSGDTFSLPFSAWETGKTRGIEQLKYALTSRELEKPHPFNDTLGHPLLYVIVPDDEYTSPQLVNHGIDRGMSRVRGEAPVYRWDTPKSGEAPRTLVPYALYNDAMDVLRAAAADYFPRMEEFSGQELLAHERNKYLSEVIEEKISKNESLSEGQQMSLQHAHLLALKKLKKDGIYDEFGLEPEDLEYTDLSHGW